MIRCLAALLDRFLDRLAPPITDVLTADDLADIEAGFDSYEPDELWADLSAHPPVSEGGGNTGNPPSPVEPADAARPGSGAGVGGFVPTKSDEQVIEELVADYRDFVRQCFKQRGG